MKVFLGFFWLAALFSLCFLIVHTALYFLREKKLFTRSSADETKDFCRENREAGRKTPERKEEQKNEPIYFIVEKKSRKKNTYSKPRQIKFQ
jgi:hypothetical protein